MRIYIVLYYLVRPFDTWIYIFAILATGYYI